MWEAVIPALGATAGNNIGKVLQKKGDQSICVQYAWLTGFLMDIGGALLMLRALSLAPVSVIQPVSGCGLAILSIFSHFYLKELMNALDWIGIALAGVGTIGVEAGGEEQKAFPISIFHLPWLAAFVAIVFIILNGWLRIYRRQRREQELMQSEVVEEVIDGICHIKAGICVFGAGISDMLLPLCIAFSLCCSGSGFFYQTRGLKHGRAIVISKCAAVASIVTGVIAGMFALGERLPTAPGPRFWLLLGWLLIILGVILLVSSTRLLWFLPGTVKRSSRGLLHWSFSGKHPWPVRTSDPNPSAVIHATTLHSLLTSPLKQKP